MIDFKKNNIMYFRRLLLSVLLELYLITLCVISFNKTSAIYYYRSLICLSLILNGFICGYTFYKYNNFSRNIIKYSMLTNAINNIIKVTAMNYFYATKMKRKFNIEKINELNKDNWEFAYVPDMLDLNNEASEEEIEQSIEYMKKWNIDIINSILTNCLISGIINGEVRRILLKYALSGIDSINDSSVTFQGTKNNKDIYKIKLQFKDKI